MARRKKGEPLSGWLIIDKPAGITSSDVVNKLRWRYGAQKAGHGGTLDPDATGVLPIAFGEATKFLPYLEDRLKTYEFWVRFGSETSTDDASGTVLRESSAPMPRRSAIIAALPSYLGQIMQTPPQVSAVKINGERAYDLARNGEEVKIEARPLWVEELIMIDEAEDRAQFRMRCGKGGYVRSIARDLGRDLGVFGHVVTLRRLETMGFSVQDGVSFTDAVETTPVLLPVESTPGFPQIEVNQGQADALKNGREIFGLGASGIVLAMFSGRATAILEVQNNVGRVARGLHCEDTK